MRVKICGITNSQDARLATDLGADALGFILAPESPRCISSEHVSTIIKKLPPFVTTVGVLTSGDEKTIEALIRDVGLNLIQFHGDFPESTLERFSQWAIQVLHVKDEQSLANVPRARRRTLLLDTYHEKLAGGSGETFNWQIAKKARALGNVILAGGLTPENVQDAIRTAQPYGVDVSSGVEVAKGKKDPAKLKQFITAAKNMENSLASSE